MDEADLSSPHKVDTPCLRCGVPYAWITPKGPHYVANCTRCGGYIKFIKKSELGIAPRRASDGRNGIKARIRALVLQRALGRCELCGKPPETEEAPLQVDHILSIDDGLAEGATLEELNHEENLCCLCEECNLGKGKFSFSPRLYVLLLRRRVLRNGRANSAAG